MRTGKRLHGFSYILTIISLVLFLIADNGVYAAPVAPATGGTITNDGTYWIHTFTSDGVFTPSKSLSVDSLVVGSGGAGAPDVRSGYGGGGGGGGGVIYTSGDSVTAQVYTIVVGEITIANSVPDGTSNGGEDSSFNGHVAIGGGGGGNEGGGVGGSGGSGGGGGGTWGVDAGVSQSDGGSPTAGQGYAGGKGQGGGGGGGGASEVGGDGGGNIGGNGGIGLLSSISGSALYYGGGGGGGSDSVGGSGGNGGGGRGGSYALDFTDGVPNTGGGGGGGGVDGPATAGNGGSGIVIIRYPMNRNDYLVTGGNPASFPIVGTSSIALPIITITDVDGDDIANTSPGEQFEISINTTDYGAVEFDQTITAGSLTVAGSCGHTSASAITYFSATTARVTVTGAGGTDTCASGATVTIAGLRVKTIHAESAPGARSLVTVDNRTTSSGTAVSTSNTVNLSVAAATLTATNVEPATLVVGETGTMTVSFTTANPIPNDGVIKVTFGAGFDVSGSTSGTCSSQDGGFITTVNGQTVILTRNGTGTSEPAGSQTCTIGSIQNPSSAGTTGVYTIATYVNDGVSGLDIDASVGADTIVPNDIAPNAPTLVSPANASATSNTTPTLSATYSDPDSGDTGTTKFRIATSAGDCLSGTVVASGSSIETTSEYQTAVWTPSSSIGADGTYYWCAKNDDGQLASSWTSMGRFVLDTIVISSGGGAATVVPPSPQEVYESERRIVLLQSLNEMHIPTNTLVKLKDDWNPKTTEDTIVYYIGTDGKRHIFPNENVYRTWYTDFSNITSVSSEDLANIPLGDNVRYRPGVRMVKFQTDPKCYAVSEQGILRWVMTEETARALYGSDWSHQIDDLSDAFFMNYSFGETIFSADQFNVDFQREAVGMISEEL